MMNNRFRKYTFEGTVIDSFSRVICHFWSGSTYAVSEAKAKNNLLYQYKRSAGLTAYAKIRLEGRMMAS